MSDIKKLQQERTQLFHDVYDNKIPKRVPINVTLPQNVIAEYAGIDIKEANWNPELVEKAAEELCGMIPSDTRVYAMQLLLPAKYQALGANNMEVSSTGTMQHPNHIGMYPEDYDALIEDPYACIIERVLPRNYRSLDFKDNPARAMGAIYQAAQGSNAIIAKCMAMGRRLNDKFGFRTADPRVGCYAPLDILSDNLRSLSGMCMDIRRIPDKVKAAVEAIYPLNYKVGLPKVITDYTTVFFPLHMATFINEKAFESLWWEPWFRQVNDYASLGVNSHAFCEHNWMRYLDYLMELPVNTRLQFEQGDPKIIKEKLGKRFILTGLFPLSTLRTCTKQECINKTREYLDIMMPGGKFIFSFDKSPLSLGDVNIENLIAVCETVRDYGVYSNPGEKAGYEFRKEDYKHSDVPEFKSKYYRTWEEYKAEFPYTPESAKAQVMAQEDMLLKYVYSLCQ